MADDKEKPTEKPDKSCLLNVESVDYPRYDYLSGAFVDFMARPYMERIPFKGIPGSHEFLHFLPFYGFF